MRPLRNIGIRRANRADLEEINALAIAATRSLCSPDYTRKQIESVLRFGLSDHKQLIDDHTYFLIENAGQLVAVGGWSYRAAAPGNGEFDDQIARPEILDPAISPARLCSFYVHPRYARRGLGRTLVALCERAAAGAGYTRLELLATPAARHLYLACGFADMEWINHVYPTGVVAVTHRMNKTIAPPLRQMRPRRPPSEARWFPVTIS